MKSTEDRAPANRIDEEGLSGDQELLLKILEKDKDFKELLGKEIRIAELVNKIRITLEYSNLTRLKKLILLLAALVESGVFATTLTEFHKQQ